ncbi:MAG: hydroxyacid dehydrogenase [Anaerolineae bacterium]|nr:hydroxyacid dehydrogenase [Anaerolineae bacterium]
MQQVLVIGQIHEAGLKILNEHKDLIVDMFSDPDVDIPVEKIEAAAAILVRYGVLTEADIENAKRLRVVSRHGVGIDNLPMAALTARGIPVAIVGSVNAVSVAEQALAMILALSKKIFQYDQAVRNENWTIRDSLATSELVQKTLLLLGFGRIGREVALRAQAFDINVHIFDPFVSTGDATDAGVEKVEDWKQILGQVDMLSLHLPLTSETQNLIDAEVLSKMKPTAILINVARGGLVDETALYNELSTRMSAGGAGIDTFEEEPLSLKSALLSLPNVIVSPHSAALTEEASKRMGVVAANNVIAGLEGHLDPSLVINHEEIDKLTS